jgi:hypothetical protein
VERHHLADAVVEAESSVPDADVTGVGPSVP